MGLRRRVCLALLNVFSSLSCSLEPCTTQIRHTRACKHKSTHTRTHTPRAHTHTHTHTNPTHPHPQEHLRATRKRKINRNRKTPSTTKPRRIRSLLQRVAVCCSALQCCEDDTTKSTKPNRKTPSTTQSPSYGVATISRLLKIIGLFCKRAL